GENVPISSFPRRYPRRRWRMQTTSTNSGGGSDGSETGRLWDRSGLSTRLASETRSHRRCARAGRIRRLGPDAHLVRWAKPTSIRSLNREAYHALPEFITVRETRIRVLQPGFRTREIVVVTTLLDPRQTTKEDLATLYRARWNNELDL